MGFSLDFAFNDSFMPESYIPTSDIFLDASNIPPLQDGFFENLAMVRPLTGSISRQLVTNYFQDYGWVPMPTSETQLRNPGLAVPLAAHVSDGTLSIW